MSDSGFQIKRRDVCAFCGKSQEEYDRLAERCKILDELTSVQLREIEALREEIYHNAQKKLRTGDKQGG